MPAITPTSNQYDARETNGTGALAITDGEIHFLWWFIQGSIMTPETRTALLRGFGFCERHAWVHLSVEMSFRKRHFLGSAILYRALIEKAVQAIQASQHVSLRSPIHRLRSAGPCFLCALNIDSGGAGASPLARLERGRDSSRLRAFASALAPLWRSTVCAVCVRGAYPTVAPHRCRPHLLSDMKLRTPIDLSWQQATLQELSDRLTRYESSFAAGAGEPSDEDRAALISAVGWCSGWRPLLALLSNAG
jgi:hypothetical protein